MFGIPLDSIMTRSIPLTGRTGNIIMRYSWLPAVLPIPGLSPDALRITG